MGRKFEDLTGKKFGKITVLRRGENYLSVKNKQSVIWICTCSCGRNGEFPIFAANLRNGRAISCKNCGFERLSRSRFKNLIGLKFNKLDVISFIAIEKGQGAIYLVRCDCGLSKDFQIRGKNLGNGHTKSCGCLNESLIALEMKKYFKEKYDGIQEHKVFKNPETDHWLPYDIYLPDHKTFVEIHGTQHYIKESFYDRTDEEFEYRKHLDKMKKDFAKKNGTYIEVDLRKIKTTEEAIKYVENKLSILKRNLKN